MKWAERLGDALLDGTPAVAAAGAAAVALLLGAAAGLAPDGTVAPGAKAVLPPEAAVGHLQLTSVQYRLDYHIAVLVHWSRANLLTRPAAGNLTCVKRP